MKYGIYIGTSPEALKEQVTAISMILQQLDAMRATPEVQLATLSALKLEAPSYTSLSNVQVNGDGNEDY